MKKTRIVRRSGVRISDHPTLVIRYVAAHPELDTFSFELADPLDIVIPMSQLLGAPEERVMGWLSELDGDSELAARIYRRSRWQPHALSRPPLGRHAARYLALRAIRPQLAIESGAKQGLGTMVMLRALERNAEEGHDGHLITIDPDPDSCWLVDAKGAARWTRSVKRSDDALPGVIAGERVGLFVSDSVPDYGTTHFELGTAIMHKADRLVVMSNGSWNSALPDLCNAHGAPWKSLSVGMSGTFQTQLRIDIGRL